jgi:hypothetical protein
MADAGWVGGNHTSATNRGVGFEGTEKGNAARTIVHFSMRQSNTTRLTTQYILVSGQTLRELLLRQFFLNSEPLV